MLTPYSLLTVLLKLVPITEGRLATTVTTQQTVVEVTTVTTDLQISKSEVNAKTTKTRINETIRFGGIFESAVHSGSVSRRVLT